DADEALAFSSQGSGDVPSDLALTRELPAPIETPHCPKLRRRFSSRAVSPKQRHDSTPGGWFRRALSAPFKTGGELRMKESYGKDPASHPDPESCVGDRKGAGEALTGAHAGQPSSCEIRCSGVPMRLSDAEGNTEGGVIGKPPSDPAQSETL